eukprot:759438-Hanusia_phi.AAC.1
MAQSRPSILEISKMQALHCESCAPAIQCLACRGHLVSWVGAAVTGTARQRGRYREGGRQIQTKRDSDRDSEIEID